MSKLDSGPWLVVETEPYAFVLMVHGRVLFSIKLDGQIERGPGFTTTDEMSLQFWQTVERMAAAYRRLGERNGQEAEGGTQGG